ncbi:hypothetical protein, partial [Vibrio parahaemolyticus]|uniref:hypothetical protein n=1 Tax=Vibrio parahaemolyticus TaxID=670 RepID=UPI00248C945B
MLSFRGKSVSSKTFDFARDQRGTKEEKTITPEPFGSGGFCFYRKLDYCCSLALASTTLEKSRP